MQEKKGDIFPHELQDKLFFQEKMQDLCRKLGLKAVSKFGIDSCRHNLFYEAH